MPSKFKNRLIMFFLITWVVIQGVLFLPTAGNDLRSIWGTIGQHGLWRSARFTQNENFANYVRFLRQTIPESSPVVLPPKGGGLPILSNTPYMQFFLSPREVTNCTDLDPQCPIEYSKAGASVLVVQDYFPGEGVIRSPDQLKMFNQDWGVYLPQASVQAGVTEPGFSSLFQVFISMILPGLWLCILLVFGYSLVSAIDSSLPAAMKFAAGFGFAMGGLSLSLGILSLASISFGQGMVLAVTLCFGVIATIAFLSGYKRNFFKKTTPPGKQAKGRFDPWMLILIFLGTITVAISVGKGYHASDEVILWGVKGLGIAAKGTLTTAAEWGTRTVNYPLNIPILIAALHILFGEALPASKIIFPMYYLSTIVLVYTFLKGRIPGSLSGLIAIVLATTPVILRQGIKGYANLPLTYYVLSAVIFFQYAIESKFPPVQNRLLLASGLSFALASWTRPEGLVLSWVLLGCASVWIYIKTNPAVKKKSLIVFSAPMVVYSIFWMIVDRMVYPASGRNAEMIHNALAQVSAGNVHLSEAGYILQYFSVSFLNIGIWGGIGFSILLLPLLAKWQKKTLPTTASIFIVAGLACFLIVLAIYQLTSYDTRQDISWWVTTGLNRMLLPAIALIWLGVASIFSKSPD